MSELLFQLYRKEVENRTAAVVSDDKPFVLDSLKQFVPTHVDGADAFNDDLDVYSDSLAATSISSAPRPPRPLWLKAIPQKWNSTTWKKSLQNLTYRFASSASPL